MPVLRQKQRTDNEKEKIIRYHSVCFDTAEFPYLKKFRFIYFLCLGATIFCLLCSWLELRLTKTGKKYYKLRLKKWHIVKEQHQYKSDDKWSTVGSIGLLNLMLSLLVPWFALSTIWPESFLMSSLDVYLKCIGVVPVLFGIIIIILEYIRKKGVNE